MNDIKVRATQSRSGLIVLNAQNGTLTLPTGKLNAEGMPGQMGGYIFLGANTIDMQDGTIVSTNQDADATASDHHINITAETIKFRGTEGLKILADGNGLPGYGLVYVAPQNAVFPRSNNQLNGMLWTFDYLSANGLLNLNGTGEGGDTAPLLVRANGNDTEVFVAGYPINFHGGDVTLRARGSTNHNIYLGYFGAFTDKLGMEVSITGKFVLDADGKLDDGTSQAAGGNIQVKADQTSLTALDSATDPSSGNIVIRANGDNTAGDGGIISVDTKSFVLGDSTRAVVNANGAPNGTGNAISSPLDSAGPFAVTFKTGATNMVFGGGNKAVKITATGGKTSGNGGTIKVLPTTGTITVRNSLALDASAIGNNCGSSCDAGQIQVIASGNVQANNGASGSPILPAIKANGAGSGTGGKIILQSTGDVVTEGSIQANGGCDGGDGGEITLTGEDVKTLGESSAQGGEGSFCLAIAASPNSFAPRLAPGSANGGKKNINANNRWLNGPLTQLHFDGKGDGKGGIININNPNNPVDLSKLPDGGISAKAGENGTGIGGIVTIASAKGAQNNPIDVNRIIKVDGGSSVDLANDSFGKISLNGVTCEQWKTGFQNAGEPFPQTVWNCVDGQRTTVMPVAAAANTFEAGPRRLLTNEPRHHIYVMPIINTQQTFFARPQKNRRGTYGFTPDTISISVAFVNVYNLAGNQADSIGYSGSNTILAATIVHESGHKLDQRWGSPSATPAFSNLRAPDYQFMDVDPTTGNARLCADVFDAASPYCTDPLNAGLTNSQIFEKEYPAVVGDDNELFALLLEHVKSTQPGAGYSTDPWLEAPLRFFPQMSAFIQAQLNQP